MRERTNLTRVQTLAYTDVNTLSPCVCVFCDVCTYTTAHKVTANIYAKFICLQTLLKKWKLNKV